MAEFKRYEACASRMELRTTTMPTRAWVDQMVDGVVKLGIEAVVGSAVDNYCRPFFPSRFYPRCHAGADGDVLRYWVDSLHAVGRPTLSWLAINHNIGLLEEHPDWQVRLIPDSAGRTGAIDGAHYPCIHSPHGDLLPEFAAEIVREFGFDGIWFDGSSLGVNNNTLPGCICGFCERRFRDDTGLVQPSRVDWTSPSFRAWVNWRYDRLMNVWKRCLDAVKAVNPNATVCYNNYRRVRYGGVAWGTGIPMRTLGWDCLMSGELDLQVFHADFQMKMHRQYGCKLGQDTWLALCDHWQMWVPDVDPEPVRHAAIAAAAAGGAMWMGTGVDPRCNPAVFRLPQEVTAPLLPHQAGQPVEYAAIWTSRQTQDFFWQDNPQGAWDGWHGANELCLFSHLPSSILFDDQVAGDDLARRHPVLLAGNAACVSDAQAAALTRYVEAGGVLVACAEIGTRDELGWPRATPVLDDLLGIKGRRPGAGRATLEVMDEALARAGGRWHTLPGPHVLATPVSGVTLLAHVVDMTANDAWDGFELASSTRPPRHPGAWVLARGRGKVVYLGVDFFAAHQQGPKTMQIRFFRELLCSLARPPVTLAGPLQVTLNARSREDGSLVVHLHNAPASPWRHGQHTNGAEVQPVQGLELLVAEGGIASARSLLTGRTFAIADDRRRARIPDLFHNDVIELRRTGPVPP